MAASALGFRQTAVGNLPEAMTLRLPLKLEQHKEPGVIASAKPHPGVFQPGQKPLIARLPNITLGIVSTRITFAGET